MVLFEHGLIYLGPKDSSPVKVRRGMAILSRDGQVAGQVAAVVIDNYNQNVTHLLLSRPGQIPEYRLIPVNLVEWVKDEMVLLNIHWQAIESLPLRQTS
jgi:sporulation protein YlmC with PRC-barrel domain